MHEGKAIREMALESRLLAQRLSKLAEGETVTYEELSELIGRDVRDCRGYLNTARRRVELDHGFLIDCVRASGVKRIPNGEFPEVGRGMIEKHRRGARRDMRRLGAADISSMTGAQKTGHLTNMAGLGAIEHFTKPKILRQIEPLVQDRTEELPIGKILQLNPV